VEGDEIVRLEEKLFLNRYVTDKQVHIKIKDPQVCLQCQDKPCTFFCPAGVYLWNEEEKRIEIGYEACVECGTCLYACPYHNIDWRNPRGGFGIMYKYG